MERPRTPPISLHAVYARNDERAPDHRRIRVRRCRPRRAGSGRQVDRALADVPALLAVLGRLTAELADTPALDRANLLASRPSAPPSRRTPRATRPARLPPRRTRRPPRPRPGATRARMSSYRQMRRQARRARRAGLQPIMVIAPTASSRRPPRDPRPAGLAVPLRTRARHHGGRGSLGGLVAPRRPPALVAVPARRLRRIRVGPRGLRPASRIAAARRTALRGHGRVRGGRLARRRGLLGPFTAPLPQSWASARSSSRSRGGRTGAAGPRSACSARSPPGPTSPRRSACPVPRSSPPPWTCGAGGPGSAWPAGRPSPT